MDQGMENNGDMTHVPSLGHQNESQAHEVTAEAGMTPNPNVIDIEDDATDSKKRKVTLRSDVWLHFERFKDAADDQMKARCNYCNSVLKAESRNGTTSLGRHLDTCKKYKPESGKQMKLNLRKSEGGVDNKALWVYDGERCRKALAYYVVIDEISFKAVEGKGFRAYSQALCPQFKIPCRTTIAKDIVQMYCEEKAKMKIFLKENTQRICITTDTWTSNQHVNYISLTAHFIDNNWKLHKKILCFRDIDSHKGIDIGNTLERCIKEWGITKLFSVTVDNATTNDVAVTYLKSKLDAWKTNVLGGKLMHMRCVAHIINPVVQDGLKEKDEHAVIDCIRQFSRFIRSSTSRYQAFLRCVESEGIKSKKIVSLDVPTRWNSTYLMLDAAISLERAFSTYELSDEIISRDLEKSGCRIPTDSEWNKAKLLHKFLSYFYQMTNTLSGSKYVTTHLVFHELTRVERILYDALHGNDDEMKRMAKRMKDKYDKYFDSFDKMNYILYYSVILDPRFKLGYMEFTFDKLYKKDTLKRDTLKLQIKKGMTDLFNEYEQIYGNRETTSSDTSHSATTANSEMAGDYFWNDYQMELNKTNGSDVKSELDLYLSEATNREGVNFDVLLWWSKNGNRFPVLSRIARDVFAVPVTTVASESAFSAGGRTIDDFRSSLLPKSVEALICFQDWLCGTDFSTWMDDNHDEIVELETGNNLMLMSK